MHQTSKSLAAIAMTAASGWAIWPAAFDAEFDRIGLDMAALAPTETFVDWLEAAYGGPIGPEKVHVPVVDHGDVERVVITPTAC
jgi:hypothetical protein